MRTSLRVATLATLPVLLAATVLATSSPASAAHRPAPVAAPAATLETEAIALTNVQRVRNGCAPVRLEPMLATAARRHSQDMATRDYFSHTSLNGDNFVRRAVNAGYRYASSENIAWGYRSAAEVIGGWMSSSGHRRNILDCSSKAVGVGVAYQGRTPYWTQVFGRV